MELLARGIEVYADISDEAKAAVTKAYPDTAQIFKEAPGALTTYYLVIENHRLLIVRHTGHLEGAKINKGICVGSSGSCDYTSYEFSKRDTNKYALPVEIAQGIMQACVNIGTGVHYRVPGSSQAGREP